MNYEELEGMSFTVEDDNGNEMECEVLFTFECEENGKTYMVYTDNTLDEDGFTKVYASTVNPEEEELKLEPVETEEEWAMIEQMLEEMQEEFGDGCDCDGDCHCDDCE